MQGLHQLQCPQQQAPCCRVWRSRGQCTRSLAARATAERRARRRDLVFDNVDVSIDGSQFSYTDEFGPSAAAPRPLDPTPSSVDDRAPSPEYSFGPDSYASAAAYAARRPSPEPRRSPDNSQDEWGGWGESISSAEWGSSGGSFDSPQADNSWRRYTDSPQGSQQWYEDSQDRYQATGAGRGSRWDGYNSSQTDRPQGRQRSWDDNGEGGHQPPPGTDRGPRARGGGAWRSYNGEEPRDRAGRNGSGDSGDSSDGWEFFASSGRGARESSPRYGEPPGPQQQEGGQEAPPASEPSDVTLLSRTEMEAVLPVTPNGRQASYYEPRNLSERLVQLMGSLAATMVLSKSTALAAPALLYPFWSPWIRAGLKNVEIYSSQLKSVGLWRAQVLEVEILASNTYRPGNWGNPRGNPVAASAVVRLLMGDPWEGGARVQLEFPYQPKAELLQVGEAVEALVMSKDEAFFAFKVIREVYAPGLGLWLAEYPFVDRTAFLDLSLQVERSRQPDSYTWPGSTDVPYTIVEVEPTPVDYTTASNGSPAGWDNGPNASYTSYTDANYTTPADQATHTDAASNTDYAYTDPSYGNATQATFTDADATWQPSAPGTTSNGATTQFAIYGAGAAGKEQRTAAGAGASREGTGYEPGAGTGRWPAQDDWRGTGDSSGSGSSWDADVYNQQSIKGSQGDQYDPYSSSWEQPTWPLRTGTNGAAQTANGGPMQGSNGYTSVGNGYAGVGNGYVQGEGGFVGGSYAADGSGVGGWEVGDGRAWGVDGNGVGGAGEQGAGMGGRPREAAGSGRT